MVVPLGSKGSGILVLKDFMAFLVIRIFGLPLFNYISFTSLGNTSWLNIVNVVVAASILPVLRFLKITLEMFSIAVTTLGGKLIDGGCVPGPVPGLLLIYPEVGPNMGNGY